MQEKYGASIDFKFVYLREAHPVDGEMPPTEAGELCIEDPVTFEERAALAQRCAKELGLDAMPLIVDGMDDALSEAYEAWPERLYLVGADGDVIWKCGRGPRGFDPDGFEAAIRGLLKLPDQPQ